MPVSATWPPPEDIANGDAGGGGIGTGATGDLPIGYTDGIGKGGTVFVGGPNVVFRPLSDRGDSHPTDIGFVAQPVTVASQYAQLQPGTRPRLNLTPSFLHDSPPRVVPDLPQGEVIDISRTKVTDADGGRRNNYGYLKDVLALNENGKLMIDLARRMLWTPIKAVISMICPACWCSRGMALWPST